MALLDVVFDWWRHRREERQDSRDQTRLDREERDELRSLYGDLIESAPDGQMRELARERRFRATLQIIAHVESEVFNETSPIPSRGELPALPAGERNVPDATAVLVAATVLGEQRRFEEALALVRFAEKLATQVDPELIFAAAAALDGLGRTEDALEEIERAFATGLPRWEVLRYQVLAFVGGGSFEEAMAVANAVIREENEEAYGLALVAYIQSHQGEHEAALSTISKACDVRPGDKNLLALRLDMAGEVSLEAAKMIAEDLLALEPANVNAHRTIAESYLQAGEIGTAIEAASKVVALEPGRSGNHTLLARVLEADGDFDAALKEFDLALQLNPGDSHALWHKLRPILRADAPTAELELKRISDVISIASAVIEHPNTNQEIRATAHQMRGVYLLIQGARDLANVDMKQAEDLGVPKGVEKEFIHLAEELQRISTEEDGKVT